MGGHNYPHSIRVEIATWLLRASYVTKSQAKKEVTVLAGVTDFDDPEEAVLSWLQTGRTVSRFTARPLSISIYKVKKLMEN